MDFKDGNINLKEVLDILKIEYDDISKYSNLFVPYLYLDGHRTSCVSDDEIEQYKNGFDFFIRFADILKSLGFKQLVTMVHTFRNLQVNGRIEAVKEATKKSVILNSHHFENSNINFYGDIELYKEIGFNDFYDFLNSFSINSRKNSFHHHVLMNYSEDWAINNLDKFAKMPDISSIIRFTKGHVSGGWIPAKMQKSSFVYSQLPSVSEFWSDEGIMALILIVFKNWITMKDFIGQKLYDKNEKGKIHEIRDNNLSFAKMNLSLNSPKPNRIIIFDIYGPIEYEIT